MMKRIFDLGLAVSMLLPAALMCLLLILPVWRDCRANPFFVQIRVGRGQRPFRLVKLRTMRRDTPDMASHEVGAAQITPLGGILRRTKLDELPQLYNVLRGEMSLVGPRPCLPSQHELIAERAARGVFDLRPGITGPAQIAGIDMSTPRALAIADAQYCGRWSAMRDIRYLLMTAFGRGRGDAAAGRLAGDG